MEDEREITAPLVVEELQAGWARKGEERPRLHVLVRMGAKTDLGRVRENNEDKFDFIEPDEPAVLARKGRFYAVADGMGGHSAGQIASELALKTVLRTYYADPAGEIESSLRRAIREANAYLVDVARTIASRNGMGTTLSAIVIRDGELYITQVGDSRVYLLREGEIQQLTEDHSWVAEQVRRGVMSLEEAEQSPYRNVITRCLGQELEVEPDITAVELRPGDRFLICSDGLSGMLPAAELFQIAGAGSPSVAAWNLIDRANLLGGKDNITALILDIEEIVPYEERPGCGMRNAERGVENSDTIDPSPPRTPHSALRTQETPRRGLMRGLFGRPDRGA